MNQIKVDFKKFERQRRALFQMALRDEFADARHDEVKELIDGTIELLDAISDEYLTTGEPVTLMPSSQYPNEDTIQIAHTHDLDRCMPLMKHKWDCSDFIEEKVDVNTWCPDCDPNNPGYLEINFDDCPKCLYECVENASGKYYQEGGKVCPICRHLRERHMKNTQPKPCSTCNKEKENV